MVAVASFPEFRYPTLTPRKLETRNASRWRHSTAMATCHYFFGGKYDLIQLHRQIRHQNARNLFFTTKLSLPPAIKIKILRKQWKCLCSDVICRLSSLFNILALLLLASPLLWSHLRPCIKYEIKLYREIHLNFTSMTHVDVMFLGFNANTFPCNTYVHFMG